MRLEKVLAGSMRRVPRNDAPALAWPLVCGSAVAERTRAVTFAAGILRVEVADAGWKRELQALAPRYVAMINRYSGQTVSRIEFVVVTQGIVEKDAGEGARATSDVSGLASFRTESKHERH
jgi:Dna[CI] antecedent DciA-like protein